MLPRGVARSSCAPSSNTWFLSTFPADKMITNDTDTQRKQWKSSCQTSTNLLNQHLLSALPGDKIDGMSAGRCQKQRKYWTIRRLEDTVAKSMCGNASHRLSTVAELGLVIGSTCRPPSPTLDGSQCLKLAGAFNFHVSPITQFFCSFGSKSKKGRFVSRSVHMRWFSCFFGQNTSNHAETPHTISPLSSTPRKVPRTTAKTTN